MNLRSPKELRCTLFKVSSYSVYDEYIVGNVRKVSRSAYRFLSQECRLLSRVAYKNYMDILTLGVVLYFKNKLPLFREHLSVIRVYVQGSEIVYYDKLYSLCIYEGHYIRHNLLEVVSVVVVIQIQLISKPLVYLIGNQCRNIIQVVIVLVLFRIGLSCRYLIYPVLESPVLHFPRPYAHLVSALNGIKSNAVEPTCLSAVSRDVYPSLSTQDKHTARNGKAILISVFSLIVRYLSFLLTRI